MRCRCFSVRLASVTQNNAVCGHALGNCSSVSLRRFCRMSSKAILVICRNSSCLSSQLKVGEVSTPVILLGIPSRVSAFPIRPIALAETWVLRSHRDVCRFQVLYHLGQLRFIHVYSFIGNRIEMIRSCLFFIAAIGCDKVGSVVLVWS